MKKILTLPFEFNSVADFPTGMHKVGKSVSYLGIIYKEALVDDDYVLSADDVEYEEYQSAFSTGIRQITIRAFMHRFTQAERTALRKSTDDIVIDIVEDFNVSTNIDLDHKDTRPALEYLVSVGLLGADRIKEMMVDGTETEKYRGEYVGV